MKLANYRTYFGNRIVLGEIIPDQFVDIQAGYARRLEVEGLHREDAVKRAVATFPGGMTELLEADSLLTSVHGLAEWLEDRATVGDIQEDCTWAVRKDRIGPPVANPRKVWAMGGNYADHREEMTQQMGAVHAETMRGFLKATSSLTGPYDPILYPPESKRVDHEMELAAVIGRRGRRISAHNALNHVVGYVAFADISSRDIGRLDQNRIDRGKGFDTFGVMGPWLVTADEVEDPYNLSIRYWVNGEMKQDGNTRDMIYKVPEQIEWLSMSMTLEPGDIISTGTPAGVSPISPGDELRGEIDILGAVENNVVLDDR
jgi:2-keto-4-pentenoate hydratase/2-oxohepta-3-ene-1,7-dioic acid hydratase in catechol pathway